MRYAVAYKPVSSAGRAASMPALPWGQVRHSTEKHRPRLDNLPTLVGPGDRWRMAGSP
jgi:hypothetical protein